MSFRGLTYFLCVFAWDCFVTFSYYFPFLIFSPVQIFYDLVRQINKKAPAKKPKRQRRSRCRIL